MNKNQIEFEDIITLDDKKEYIVVSNINYNEKEYIYIAEIGNPNNAKYAEVEKENSEIYISVIDNTEEKLLNTLKPLFLKQALFKETKNNK